MQLLDSSLQLSASDLSRFLSCRHCTSLDMEVAQGLRKAPYFSDPFLEMLRARGEVHGKEYIKSIEAGGDEVLGLAGIPPSEAADRCLEAIRRGQPECRRSAATSDRYG